MKCNRHFLGVADDAVAIATAMEMSEMVGKTSIAIQANDYEIERRSGILPARRRIIPFKFRCTHSHTQVFMQDENAKYYSSAPSAVSERPNLNT